MKTAVVVFQPKIRPWLHIHCLFFQYLEALERVETGGKTEEALVLKERMGCTQSYISQIEHPEARPTLGPLKQVAEALGCPIKDLVDRRRK